MKQLEELKGEALGVVTLVVGDAVALGALGNATEQIILATASTLGGLVITVIATIRHKTNTEAKTANARLASGK